MVAEVRRSGLRYRRIGHDGLATAIRRLYIACDTIEALQLLQASCYCYLLDYFPLGQHLVRLRFPAANVCAVPAIISGSFPGGKPAKFSWATRHY